MASKEMTSREIDLSSLDDEISMITDLGRWDGVIMSELAEFKGDNENHEMISDVYLSDFGSDDVMKIDGQILFEVKDRIWGMIVRALQLAGDGGDEEKLMIGLELAVPLAISEFIRDSVLRISHEAIISQLARKVEGLRLDNRRISDMSEVDPLTGLKNRTFLKNHAFKFLAEALYQRKPMSLVMLDLDGMKECNDGHGHLVGDKLLQYSAIVMKSCTRRPRLGVEEEDIVVRLGGDEFLIICLDTTAEGACAVGRRIANNFGGYYANYPDELEQQPTVSVGICNFSIGEEVYKEWSRHVENRSSLRGHSQVEVDIAKHEESKFLAVVFDKLLSDADGALYCAKGKMPLSDGTVLERGGKVVFNGEELPNDVGVIKGVIDRYKAGASHLYFREDDEDEAFVRCNDEAELTA